MSKQPDCTLFIFPTWSHYAPLKRAFAQVHWDEPPCFVQGVHGLPAPLIVLICRHVERTRTETRDNRCWRTPRESTESASKGIGHIQVSSSNPNISSRKSQAGKMHDHMHLHIQ